MVIGSQTVVAALAGAIATYGAQLFLDERKERQKAHNFRRALRAELIQMKKFRESIEEVQEEGEFSIEALLILSSTEYPFF